MNRRRVAVFCGSRPGRSSKYLAAAREVGRLLAERDIGLVYGGASVGIMGALADAALAAGGEVIGVIPVSLIAREIAHHGVTELIQVHSLAERKERMFTLASGFLTLPGGMGTLDELFETLTFTILRYHDKPSVLLDLDGYYSHMLAFLDHAVGEGFIDTAHRELLIMTREPEAAIDALAPPGSPGSPGSHVA